MNKKDSLSKSKEIVFCCVQKVKRIIPIVGKIIAILCGILGIVLYYTHRYIFKLFGSISMEQILCYVFHSAEGVDDFFCGKHIVIFSGWHFLFCFGFYWCYSPKK